MERHFTKENIKLANTHMKKCSTSGSLGKWKFKPQCDIHYTPRRMAKIKDLSSVGEDMGQGYLVRMQNRLSF